MAAIPKRLAGAQRCTMADESRCVDESRRIKVLIVDDDETFLWTLRRMLRRDAEVTTAHSGEEALAEIVAGNFDAVLCDVSLAGMIGHEVWDAIRRGEPELAERVVFMTGGATTAEDRAFLETVADRLLLKPFDHVELVAALRRFARR